MSIRSAMVVAVLWVFSLLAVGTIVWAQAYPITPLPAPRILSGADFGIRVEGEQNGVLVGPLVARIEGKWVEVQLGSAKGGAHRVQH